MIDGYLLFQVREGEDDAINPEIPGGREERAWTGGRARPESASVQPPGNTRAQLFSGYLHIFGFFSNSHFNFYLFLFFVQEFTTFNIILIHEY